MHRQKKPFQEKNPKAVHKATAPFGQREPCVSPWSCNSTETTRAKKSLDPPSFLFLTYILLSEISVSGNKPGPGRFAWSVRKEVLGPTEQG